MTQNSKNCEAFKLLHPYKHFTYNSIHDMYAVKEILDSNLRIYAKEYIQIYTHNSKHEREMGHTI